MKLQKLNKTWVFTQFFISRCFKKLHNIAPWWDCFLGALLRAYKEFEERADTIERGHSAKGDQVRAKILKRHLPFSISEIKEASPRISQTWHALSCAQ